MSQDVFPCNAIHRGFEIVAKAVVRTKRPLRGKDQIGLRVGKVLGQYTIAKHFKLTIADDSFRYERDENAIASEAALNGIYVVRTTVSAERLACEEVVHSYKRLADVERAFRSLFTFAPSITTRPTGCVPSSFCACLGPITGKREAAIARTGKREAAAIAPTSEAAAIAPTGRRETAVAHTGNREAAIAHTGNREAAIAHTGNREAAIAHTGNREAAIAHTGNREATVAHTGRREAAIAHTGRGTAACSLLAPQPLLAT